MDEMDDFERELALLNEALDAAPSTNSTYKPTPSTSVLDDDDDLFADIEEILNEERRNLGWIFFVDLEAFLVGWFYDKV